MTATAYTHLYEQRRNIIVHVSVIIHTSRRYATTQTKAVHGGPDVTGSKRSWALKSGVGGGGRWEIRTQHYLVEIKRESHCGRRAPKITVALRSQNGLIYSALRSSKGTRFGRRASWSNPRLVSYCWAKPLLHGRALHLIQLTVCLLLLTTPATSSSTGPLDYRANERRTVRRKSLQHVRLYREPRYRRNSKANWANARICTCDLLRGPRPLGVSDKTR